jgi:hypothetical protein
MRAVESTKIAVGLTHRRLALQLSGVTSCFRQLLYRAAGYGRSGHSSPARLSGMHPCQDLGHVGKKATLFPTCSTTAPAKGDSVGTLLADTAPLGLLRPHARKQSASSGTWLTRRSCCGEAGRAQRTNDFGALQPLPSRRRSWPTGDAEAGAEEGEHACNGPRAYRAAHKAPARATRGRQRHAGRC